MTKECSNCKHWQESKDCDGLPHEGVCRRYPPVTICDGKDYDFVQPFTDPADYCGEWAKIEYDMYYV